MRKPILYNFKKYAQPKNGLFSMEKEPYKYDPNIGWIRRESKEEIIGETDDSYVTEIIKSSHGEWVGSEVIQKKTTSYSGIHKSRFVKWGTGQLQLF